MPMFGISVFAGLYGIAAASLVCHELFFKNSGAEATRAPAKNKKDKKDKRKKAKPKWWKPWCIKASSSSDEGHGVQEPPNREERLNPRNQHPQKSAGCGTFLDPEVAFAGFSAEHPAAHLSLRWISDAASVAERQRSQTCLEDTPELPQLDFVEQPRPQTKHLPASSTYSTDENARHQGSSSSFWTETSNPSIRPNVESFEAEYELIRTFGDISQAVVHLVRHRSSGERCIIKQIPALKRRNGEVVSPDEAHVLMNVLGQHPNILRVRDCFLYTDAGIPNVEMANVVFEFCEGGDVADFARGFLKRKESCPEWFILHFASSMIDALAFIHCGDVEYDPETDTTRSVRHRQPAVLHRDWKPGNIFIRRGRKADSKYGLPTLVLGDFGFAQPEATTVGCAYTPGFVAPELQKLMDETRRGAPAPKNTTATDMFAFGVSLWELLTFRSFTPGKSDIWKGFNESSVRDHWSILTLLETCLSSDPARRPRANELHKISAEFKAKLQAWYDAGGRLPRNIWQDSFEVEEMSTDSLGLDDSTRAIAPHSTPRVQDSLLDSAPPHWRPCQNASDLSSSPRVDSGDAPVSLFTNEPVTAVSSSNAEVDVLETNLPMSAFSWSSTDDGANTDDDELYT